MGDDMIRNFGVVIAICGALFVFGGETFAIWTFSAEMKTDFEDSEFSKEFDSYLYQDVGYPILVSLTIGLYNSPYAATSLREYFAIGFEEFFIGDQNYLKKISLQIFNKINNLVYF